MKRIAIVVTLACLAACAKGDKTNATDTSTAGGSVAPAAADSMGGMKSGSSMSDSLRKSDSAHMAASSIPTPTSDSSAMNGPAKGESSKKSPTP